MLVMAVGAEIGYGTSSHGLWQSGQLSEYQ